MTTVEQEQVASAELASPPSVQAALGELVNTAKDGLLALSVGVSLGVLSTLMEEEVCDVVGPKGGHDPDRTAVRHGHTGGEVTLGDRRSRSRGRGSGPSTAKRSSWRPTRTSPIAIRSPGLEQMLAGVSTRRFQHTREPVGEDVLAAECSASKSAASRAFVGSHRRASAGVDVAVAGRQPAGGADA